MSQLRTRDQPNSALQPTPRPVTRPAGATREPAPPYFSSNSLAGGIWLCIQADRGRLT